MHSLTHWDRQQWLQILLAVCSNSCFGNSVSKSFSATYSHIFMWSSNAATPFHLTIWSPRKNILTYICYINGNKISEYLSYNILKSPYLVNYGQLQHVYNINMYYSMAPRKYGYSNIIQKTFILAQNEGYKIACIMHIVHLCIFCSR